MHLAELNIGRLKAPVGDPLVAEFIDHLDRINALAEWMPGFVWRLKGDNGNVTGFKRDGDALEISNLSVWKSIGELET